MLKETEKTIRFVLWFEIFGSISIGWPSGHAYGLMITVLVCFYTVLPTIKFGITNLLQNIYRNGNTKL